MFLQPAVATAIPNPLPVSGPLTDAQLRATPVPVSGEVVTGGLTDDQLRASAVPVSVASLPLPSGAATEATLALVATEATALLSLEALQVIRENTNVLALQSILDAERGVYA